MEDCMETPQEESQEQVRECCDPAEPEPRETEQQKKLREAYQKLDALLTELQRKYKNASGTLKLVDLMFSSPLFEQFFSSLKEAEKDEEFPAPVRMNCTMLLNVIKDINEGMDKHGCPIRGLSKRIEKAVRDEFLESGMDLPDIIEVALGTKEKK